MHKSLPVMLGLVVCGLGCGSEVKEPPARAVPQPSVPEEVSQKPEVEMTDFQKRHAEEAGKKVLEEQARTAAIAEDLKKLGEQMHQNAVTPDASK